MSLELRPTKLSDIEGQKKTLERLTVSISSAKKRNETLSHVLLTGPPGLGKTTSARAIANEMGGKLIIGNGGNLKSVKAILPYVMSIEENTVFFIDEIHRMPAKVKEFLYPVLEEFRVDDHDDDEFSMDVPKFTCIGATTNIGGLPQPLIDRFPLQLVLELYDVDTLSKIVMRNAVKLELTTLPDAARAIAMRGRGTPRVTNNLLLWVRDCAVDKHAKVIDKKLVDEAMAMMEIDENGITVSDRAYLKVLKDAKGAAVSLPTLSATLNMDQETIENTIEPFLLRSRLISKTNRGRILL